MQLSRQTRPRHILSSSTGHRSQHGMAQPAMRTTRRCPFVPPPQTLTAAVQIINAVPVKRLNSILTRIAQRHHEVEEEAFSEDERYSLQVALDIDPKAVSLLLDTLSFFFDTTQIILKTWADHGAQLVDTTRNQPFFSTSLVDTRWQASVQTASHTQTRTTVPMGHLQLELADNANQVPLPTSPP
ncbi:uncharacterized protein MONBRDRAFT_13056 [Monosiga brevicollis MX1]|uniref:COMM domain-containing protein n=1 Tax=Monosiga brevicollis TaxID=81824 RepID=A9VE60_MONBE|nr:uncharacterized protein MONBRDRAFT_13056 [Monosiga brevicollis MX1]EDQ84174.1 predicted protein [Monosiga brevicollis MX1]|eukprot:XP_001751004.1 hypothetical protein [Monosiga brevicollis MX1]